VGDVYHVGDDFGVSACLVPVLAVVGWRGIVVSLPPGKHTKIVITTLFVITFALIALFRTNPCALSLGAASSHGNQASEISGVPAYMGECAHSCKNRHVTDLLRKPIAKPFNCATGLCNASPGR
jgi:hypothetical protein